jgi:dethiobiotin synthetase
MLVALSVRGTLKHVLQTIEFVERSQLSLSIVVEPQDPQLLSAWQMHDTDLTAAMGERMASEARQGKESDRAYQRECDPCRS